MANSSNSLQTFLGSLCGVKLPVDFKHFYTITPSNFMILSRQKQIRKLQDFSQLLRNLEKEMKITLTRTPIMVPYKGVETRMDVLQVLIDSMEPLDDILEELGYSFTIDENHPSIKIQGENSRNFLTSFGNEKFYGRGYTVYKMPTKLPPAWIHSVFRSFHQLEIYIKPVRADDAMKKVDNKELLYVDNQSSKADMKKKLNDIKILKEDLELGNTSAFEFGVNGFVFAQDKTQLIQLNKQIQKNMSAINVRVSSSIAQQRNLVNGESALWLADVGSLSILYPFASADMLETPNGIFLGTNVHTQGPIICDPDSRKNHNVYLAGTTGSGKSFTWKIFCKRFMEKHPGCTCIGIDPQEEYLPYAGYFGLDSLKMIPGKQYGIDPFKLCDTKIEAADLLGIVTNAPNQVRKEWRSKCNDEINSTDELFEKSSKDARQYLTDLVNGPVAEMFKGELKFSDRMLISLKELDGQEYEGLIILLVLAYAWKRVNTLPPNMWKVLFLDEAWRVTKLNQAIKKIGDVARQGRKKSLLFGIITQQFSDLDRALDDDSKLTELFDTKIIMQLSQSAANSAGKALDLTEDEIDKITNFKQGYGMIQTSDNTIYAKFEATEEETKTYFNTKAEKKDD